MICMGYESGSLERDIEILVLVLWGVVGVEFL